VSQTIPEQGHASAEAMAALASVARAVSDPKRRAAFQRDPRSEVADFDRLPAAVQDALTSLSADELAALAKLSGPLIENGFYVKTSHGPLEMF
jgi:hypothetical protein